MTKKTKNPFPIQKIASFIRYIGNLLKSLSLCEHSVDINDIGSRDRLESEIENSKRENEKKEGTWQQATDFNNS
jgi:hypothetical protein